MHATLAEPLQSCQSMAHLSRLVAPAGMISEVCQRFDAQTCLRMCKIASHHT
jgi:hypothetical protein